MKLITIFNDQSQNNFLNINQNFDIAQDAILKNYKIDHKTNSNIKYFYNNINLKKIVFQKILFYQQDLNLSKMRLIVI